MPDGRMRGYGTCLILTELKKQRHTDFYIPVLKVLEDLKEHEVNSLIAATANLCNLSDEERREKTEYIETTTILNRRISFCPNVMSESYRTLTLFEALNSIRTDVYGKQVGDVRRMYLAGNTVSYRKKKKQLPAYVFSGMAYGRRYKFDIAVTPR